jgi:hypothetical protein
MRKKVTKNKIEPRILNEVFVSAIKVREHLAAIAAGKAPSASQKWPDASANRLASPLKPDRMSQQKRVLEVLPVVFPPDGYPPTSYSLLKIQKCIEPEFAKRKWPRASTDTISRALGRRG